MRRAFGHIEWRGPDTARIWWRAGGRKHSETVHGSRLDVELALARKQIESQGLSSDSKWGEYWMLRVEPSLEQLEAHTQDGYRKSWKVLAPWISERWISQTTPRYVEMVLGKLPAGQAVKAAKLWRKMARMAVKDGGLPVDPFEMVSVKAPPRKPKRLLDVEEVPAWMEAIRGIKYEPVLLAELGGGLRHEEACALTWEDVTAWEHRGIKYAVLSVSKALVCVNGRKILKGTKTALSGREVVCGEPFASRLLALSEAKAGPLLASGAEDGADPAAPYSSPITMTHNLRAWSLAHGVTYVCPGNLRSSFATMQGEAGSPDSLVSLAMGHADGTTKGTHYQQATRRAGALIADNLADFIGCHHPGTISDGAGT